MLPFFRWETTATDDGLTPAAGGAWLTYTDTNVTGGFNSGIPSVLDSYLAWVATSGSLKEDSRTVDKATETAEAFLKYCLLSKPNDKDWSDVMGTEGSAGSYFNDKPSLTSEMKELNGTEWTSTNGYTNTFCVDKVCYFFFAG